MLSILVVITVVVIVVLALGYKFFPFSVQKRKLMQKMPISSYLLCKGNGKRKPISLYGILEMPRNTMFEVR